MPARLQQSPRRSPSWVSDSPRAPQLQPPTPPQSIDARQARVDQLAEQADIAAQRHDQAAAKLAKTRAQLRQATQPTCDRHQRLIRHLRAQVAGAGRRRYDGRRQCRLPPTHLAARSTRGLKRTPTAMLANVVLVSEDTGGRAEALARVRTPQIETARRAQGRAAAAARPASPAARRPLRSQEQAVDHARSQAPPPRSTTSQAKAAKRSEHRRPGAWPTPWRRSATPTCSALPDRDAFDCSGLTMAAWSQAGVSLPHSSSAQYSSGRHISESELQPGDLVFYYSPISHVGMYIGNGQIVNALNPGAGVADLRPPRHAVRRCGAPWRLTTRSRAARPVRGGRLRAVRASSRVLLAWSSRAATDEVEHQATRRRRRTAAPSAPRTPRQTLDQLVERARQSGSRDDAVATGRPGSDELLGWVLRQRAALRIGDLSMRYVDEGAPLDAARPGRVRPGRLARVGAARLPLRRVRHRRRRGSRPARSLRARPATACGSRPSAAPSARTPLWLVDQLSVVRTPQTLLAVAGDSPGRYPRLVHRAVRPGAARAAGLERAACSWRCRDSGDELDAAAATREPGEYDNIAAVTTTADGSLAPDAPVRVFVNPHGLRPASSSAAPRW